MSTYSINANLGGMTIQQRDSFVDAVQTLGATKLESMNIREIAGGIVTYAVNINLKLESMNIREVTGGTVTYAINANLKLLTGANTQTIVTNITTAGSEKIIALNIRRVTE